MFPQRPKSGRRVAFCVALGSSRTIWRTASVGRWRLTAGLLFLQSHSFLIGFLLDWWEHGCYIQSSHPSIFVLYLALHSQVLHWCSKMHDMHPSEHRGKTLSQRENTMADIIMPRFAFECLGSASLSPCWGPVGMGICMGDAASWDIVIGSFLPI
jgi:hypothetical protein